MLYMCVIACYILFVLKITPHPSVHTTEITPETILSCQARRVSKRNNIISILLLDSVCHAHHQGHLLDVWLISDDSHGMVRLLIDAG
jgi:hypothetical protein